MIKAQYSDPTFQNHGFAKHIHHRLVDMGVYPGTNEPLIELYKIIMIENLPSTGGGGGKPRNLALFRKALGPREDPSANVWHTLRVWKEGVEYDDASAGGSVDVDTATGDVHVMLTFGKKNGAGVVAFQDWEETIKRNAIGPPIERRAVAGSVGPAGPKGAKGDKGDPGVQGPPGTAGTGGGGEDSAFEAVRQAIKAWLLR